MANTYYVSGTGDDSKNGLKERTAFRTFGKVSRVLQAGDTVYVMNGTYTNPSPNSSIILIKGLQATATQPTTIKAYPGHTPILEAHGNNWNAVSIIGSSHVVVEGLTMVGARDEISLEYALQQKNNLNNSATSGNGIQVTYLEGANKTEAEKIHSTHVVIRNNNISKFPGGGIGTSEVDYVTIENNVVSGNNYYSPYGNQGISHLHLWNSDNNTTDYKILIQGNTVFDNEQKVPWYQQADGKITEGHGIMLDSASNFDTTGIAYTGKVLIANNASYNNGGAGIQIYNSSNPVDIVNNTTYQNSRTLAQFGEVAVNYANNVRAFNNILFAREGSPANLISRATNVIFDRNLVYNGTFKASDNVANTGLINLVRDPLFVDPLKGDFALKSGSPAINAGNRTVVLRVDQRGYLRDSRIDIGAFEAGASSSASIIMGGTGDDILMGTPGKDKLLGYGGNDALINTAGADLLSGGTGADRFIYSGKNQRKALANSRVKSLDHITDFGTGEGDRIQLDYDQNLSTVQLPKKLFYVGQVQGSNLSAAVRAAYSDKNQRTSGKQVLAKNEAVFLTWKGHTYLSVNDKSRPFSPSYNLVVDMTGIALSNRDSKMSVLAIPNYFV